MACIINSIQSQSLLKINIIAKNNCLSPFYFNFANSLNHALSPLGLVRFICKSPGQSQKQRRKRGRDFRLKVPPGDWVDERTVIGTQKHLIYHPGYNVGLDPRNKNLYSLSAGTVYYSIEKFEPNFANQFVEQFYPNFQGPLYKKYIHVVPEKPESQFKLIDLI